MGENHRFWHPMWYRIIFGKVFVLPQVDPIDPFWHQLVLGLSLQLAATKWALVWGSTRPVGQF